MLQQFHLSFFLSAVLTICCVRRSNARNTNHSIAENVPFPTESFAEADITKYPSNRIFSWSKLVGILAVHRIYMFPTWSYIIDSHDTCDYVCFQDVDSSKFVAFDVLLNLRLHVNIGNFPGKFAVTSWNRNEQGNVVVNRVTVSTVRELPTSNIVPLTSLVRRVRSIV